ncbi:hypothetical protein CHARACLAT_013242 [Characodon lateralis]|uniref:Uncharacterized protein n=1 Tax=Characodon lateralis TaxID=208331 RepID=A0ABU7DI18_9TELE|nr:hypothetical protein [Characodon lateralis]
MSTWMFLPVKHPGVLVWIKVHEAAGGTWFPTGEQGSESVCRIKTHYDPVQKLNIIRRKRHFPAGLSGDQTPMLDRFTLKQTEDHLQETSKNVLDLPQASGI